MRCLWSDAAPIDENQAVVIGGDVSAGENQVRIDSISHDSVVDESIGVDLKSLSSGMEINFEVEPIVSSIGVELKNLVLEAGVLEEAIVADESAGGSRLGLDSAPRLVVTGDGVIGEEMDNLSLEEPELKAESVVDESAGGNRFQTESISCKSGVDELIGVGTESLSLEERVEEMNATDESAGGSRLELDLCPSLVTDEYTGDGRENLNLEEVVEEMSELISSNVNGGGDRLELNSGSPCFSANANQSVSEEGGNLGLGQQAEVMPERIVGEENAAGNRVELDSAPCKEDSDGSMGEESGDTNFKFICEEKGKQILKEEVEEKLNSDAANGSAGGRRLAVDLPPTHSFTTSALADFESFVEEIENMGLEEDPEQRPELFPKKLSMQNDDSIQEEGTQYLQRPEYADASYTDIELLQGDVNLKKLEENLGMGEGLENLHDSTTIMRLKYIANLDTAEENLEKRGNGIQENVRLGENNVDLEQLQGDTGNKKLEDNLGMTEGLKNEEMVQEEDAGLKELEDKFEKVNIRENEAKGGNSAELKDSLAFEDNLGSIEGSENLQDHEEIGDNADVESSACPFAENLVHAKELENLQCPNEKPAQEEDANLEKLEGTFEATGVQENVGWAEGNAYLREDSPSVVKQRDLFVMSGENSGWIEDTAPWDSVDNIGGGDDHENTSWEYRVSLAENAVWSTGLEDGVDMKEEHASPENGVGKSEGGGHYGVSDSESNSTKYPQRHGARDCSYYIRTGNCQFGSNCKFNHPPHIMYNQASSWHNPGSVQVAGEVGKELSESSPWGQCKMYLKTGICKHRSTCRYSHSGQNQKATNIRQLELNFLGLPLRPGEKKCDHYMRTGSCKFLTNCRFHHPNPSITGEDPSGYKNSAPPEPPSSAPQLFEMSQSSNTSKEPTSLSKVSEWAMLFPPKRTHSASDWNESQASVCPSTSNSSCPTLQKDNPVQWQTQINDYTERRDQPLSPGSDRPSSQVGGHTPHQANVEDYTETHQLPVCLYFMNFGTCKYGSVCKFQHQQQAQMEYMYQPVCPSFMNYGTCQFGSTCMYQHPVSVVSDVPTTWEESHVQPQKQMEEYPHRPGERLCSYFIKTGTCNFKSACKFHHPSPSTMTFLTPQAGSPDHNQGQIDEYPQRPGEPLCSYFVRFKTCKFRSACRFHHPSPSTLGGLTTEADGRHQRQEYVERPGEPECPSFMKYGSCNFGATCKYHHPNDLLPSMPTCPISSNGLPLRPDKPTCFNYSRFGICKMGPLCEFDHPPDSGSSVQAADSASGQGSLTDDSEW